jgi:hypothetical protein
VARYRRFKGERDAEPCEDLKAYAQGDQGRRGVCAAGGRAGRAETGPEDGTDRTRCGVGRRGGVRSLRHVAPGLGPAPSPLESQDPGRLPGGCRGRHFDRPDGDSSAGRNPRWFAACCAWSKSSARARSCAGKSPVSGTQSAPRDPGRGAVTHRYTIDRHRAEGTARRGL